ncbi:c-type cytochrome [uncultured Tenacibaculum sp.]|uniref:c-type cytochrome n=1 Tax=uncultured Tenacibaculum sp. TaxID=174713 RepID=UPI002615F51E|nr:c-type cytochrome [uncultured Tenacibaculum sp.]
MVVFITIMMMLFSSMIFSETAEEEPRFFCGTVDTITEEQRAGRKLFNANCASCHKLDKDMTGPALRGVKFDSLSLHEYLSSKKHQPTFPQLSIEQINEILKYTKD